MGQGRLGIGLRVAVVPAALPTPPAQIEVVDREPRLSEALDPAWLDDRGCAGELHRITDLRARLDAYEVGVVARLADLRPDFWQDTDQPGRGADGWAPQREFAGLSEFFVDEVALVLGISRTRAHTVANTALVLTRQLVPTWHALGDGLIDLAQARALVHVLGWQQPAVSPDVIAAVEAEALGWAISGEGPHRLQNRAAALLLQRDAEAADRARKEAARSADVHLQPRRDGLTDLVIALDPAIAAACRDATDRYARMRKDDGDTRPIGQLRTLAAADLLLRPWDTTRPPVKAHITVHARLPSLRPPGTGTTVDGQEDDEVEECGTVSGQPITSAHLRELLAQWAATGLDGLHAPEGGDLDIALVDPDTGELRVVLTEPQLRRAAAPACRDHPDAASCRCPVAGRPPPTGSYRPTAAQRRFVAARDRGCRHPGCTRPAIWTDLDHVTAHRDGGPTDCGNLCTLCRRHHRLKTHAPGWRYAMTPDGMLAVTTPSGVTRTTRPPGTGHGLALLERLLDPAAVAPAQPDLAPAPCPDDDPPPF